MPTVCFTGNKGIKGALKAVESHMGLKEAANTAKHILRLIISEYDGHDLDDEAIKAMAFCIETCGRHAKSEDVEDSKVQERNKILSQFTIEELEQYISEFKQSSIER
jgi:hypothetical protein